MIETTTPITNNIIDLDLSDLKKKKIRIDGDDNKILEINTSDLNLVTRVRQLEPRLEELSNTATELAAISVESDFNNFADKITAIDNEMRSIMDFIFQTNVSEVCASEGSMFDPINGSSRWEIILGALLQLYDESVKIEMSKDSTEIKNMQRVNFHTDKYVKTNDHNKSTKSRNTKSAKK